MYITLAGVVCTESQHWGEVEGCGPVLDGVVFLGEYPMDEGGVSHVCSDALGSVLPHSLASIHNRAFLAGLLLPFVLFDGGLPELAMTRMKRRCEVLGAQVDGGLLIAVLLPLLLCLLHLGAHHDHAQLLLHHEVVLLHEILLLGHV